jgi:hypothetical protein
MSGYALQANPTYMTAGTLRTDGKARDFP